MAILSTVLSKLGIVNSTTIYIDYLNKRFTFKEEDEWTSFEDENEKQYDIHYCEDYNEVVVYEYNKELDEPIHRFIVLANQKIT